MNNLFDIVMNAGNGQAVQAMMRQNYAELLGE